MTVRSAPAAQRTAATVRFHDLGPLTVERDGEPLPLAGARLTAALAMLLIHTDRVVGTDALAEAMWGSDSAPRSPSTLDSHVWRLRNVLEPGRARGEPATMLLRQSNGYRLLATADQVDSLRFAELAEETLSLLADGQADRALRRTDQALALWRGRPFAAVADEPWARPAVARLEELHAQVQERRVDALLAVGKPDRALLQLEQAIAEQPLRERLWAQRMLACYRSGRVDAALTAYRDARQLFLDELGVEPGSELRELQTRILAEDPALAGAPRRAVPVPVHGAVEIHVPARHSRLIGRDDERERIGALVAAHRLVTVVGAAGCGKTRLAIDVARAAAPAFPDGVWAVDLTAAQDGDQVLPTLTSALGIAAPTTGSVEAAMRAFTRGRRMLLLLDNCEHVLDAVAELVDDLLVDGSELAVLGTSREPLDVDGEVLWALTPLALPEPGTDVLTSPAVELFLDRLTAAGGAAVTGGERLALVARICRAVDGVPLAMELAAARSRAYSLEEIADQVTVDPSTLARIGRGPADHHRTVRFAVEQSYQTLGEDEAALHRAVSVVAGPFTAGLAAAVLGRPVHEVHDLLALLAHRSMLVAQGPAGPGRPSRFAQLATVRGHAAHAATAELDELTARRDRWVAGLVTALPRLGSLAEADWFAALDDDLLAVRATLRHNLVDTPSALGVRIAARLGLYWYYRGMMVEAGHWQQRATDVVDAEPVDRAMVRHMLGGSLTMANRWDLGGPLIEEGRALVRGTSAERSPTYGDILAVLGGALFIADQVEVGRSVAADVREVATATGDATLNLMARLCALLSEASSTDPGRVAGQASAVFDEAEAAGNTFAAWMSSQAAADAALASGDVENGMRWSDRMVTQLHTLRVREGPTLLEARANLVALAGDARSAVRLYAAARAHHQRAGMRWPNRSATADAMRRAMESLDRVELELAWQEGTHLTLDDLEATRPPLTGGR